VSALALDSKASLLAVSIKPWFTSGRPEGAEERITLFRIDEHGQCNTLWQTAVPNRSMPVLRFTASDQFVLMRVSGALHVWRCANGSEVVRVPGYWARIALAESRDIVALATGEPCEGGVRVLDLTKAMEQMVVDGGAPICLDHAGERLALQGVLRGDVLVVDTEDRETQYQLTGRAGEH